MLLANKLFAGVATDGAKRVVHVCDGASAVCSGNDGVQVHGVQQRVAVAQRSLQTVLGIALDADVGFNGHEPLQRAVCVAQGLNFNLYPVGAPVFGIVEHGTFERLAVVQHFAHGCHCGFVGVFTLEQFTG